jgi:hypothetical protein
MSWLEIFQNVQAPPVDYVQAAIEAVSAIEIEPISELVAETASSYQFDPETNIIDSVARERFRDDQIMAENDKFTEVVSTTNTMEGFIENVSFVESEIMGLFTADCNIVRIKSNHGDSIYPGYNPNATLRKTNRGRKKREKPRKPRKCQGSGKEFNSQITFMVRSAFSPLEPDGTVPADAKIYKFKVFRNGRIQLPGAQRHMADDVVNCAMQISDMLNRHLHAGEVDCRRLANLVNLRSVMTNYKFRLKLEEDCIIDLEELADALEAHKASGAEPKIHLINFARDESKVSAKFYKPESQNGKKTTHVNIFMKGKINILGALGSAGTRAICQYLYTLFSSQPALVTEIAKELPPPPDWEPNVCADSEKIDAIWNKFTCWKRTRINKTNQ